MGARCGCAQISDVDEGKTSQRPSPLDLWRCFSRKQNVIAPEVDEVVKEEKEMTPTGQPLPVDSLLPQSPYFPSPPSPPRDPSPRPPRLFRLAETVDYGTGGLLPQCLDMTTGRLFAMKRISIEDQGEARAEQIGRIDVELMLQRCLCHRNLVRLHSAEMNEEEATVDVLFELVPGGSLRTLLHSFGALDERLAALYLHQVLEGLSYLHSMDVILRDIGPSDVLLDTDGTVKLAGLTRLDSNVFEGQEELGMKMDIENVGLLLVELLTGRNLHSDSPPKVPVEISPSCKDFLRLTLQRDPNARPTASNLLHHAFFGIEARPSPEILNAHTVESLFDTERVSSGRPSQLPTPAEGRAKQFAFTFMSDHVAQVLEAGSMVEKESEAITSARHTPSTGPDRRAKEKKAADAEMKRIRDISLRSLRRKQERQKWEEALRKDLERSKNLSGESKPKNCNTMVQNLFNEN